MDRAGNLAMRVLLLKNYPSSSPSDHLFVQSFSENITASVPGARLDICCIANGESIPELSDYELVILSGGRVNLLEGDKPLWVTSVLEMIRKVASDEHGPKLLGICWGHQAVHYALGGKLAWLEDHPRVSCPTYIPRYAWRFARAHSSEWFAPGLVFLWSRLILSRLACRKSNSGPPAKTYSNEDHLWFVATPITIHSRYNSGIDQDAEAAQIPRPLRL